MQRVFGPAFVLVLIMFTASQVVAAEWGHLRGQFIYNGEPPKPRPAKITKDKDCCGKHNVVNEELLIDPESNGVRNVVVYLYSASGSRSRSKKSAPVPVHESYKATENAEKKLDNMKCRFDPHVVLLRTTQTLLVANSDPIGHNTKVDTFRNDPINYTTPPNGSLKHQFKTPEGMPARVSCSIHPWMVGWILIRDNPYMAVTDKDGKFEIKNLPAGKKLQFMFWHEKAGYVKNVTINDEKQEWAKGRTMIAINPGDNELGTITLEPSLFKEE